MGSSLRNVRILVGKELRGYADSPTAYIAAVIFLLLWQFLFFRDAFLLGEASLRGLYGLLPWLFLLLVPAITMGSIAAEKREGTLEYLLTHPLRDGELVAAKFLAPTIFTTLVLAFALPVGASFARYGNLDWGVVAGQYLASVLLAATLVSLGIFVSSLLRSQVSALLVTAAAAFVLVILGMDLATARLPLPVASVVSQLGVLTHYESMARGVLDLRDIWYFASAIAIFLALAYLQLRRRRFGNRKGRYRALQLGVALFIGIAVLGTVLGSRIPGRIDLTEGGIYTLTDATRDRLDALDDVVTIDLYRSGELPTQLQPVLRDVQDLLRDYDTIGGGDVVVDESDPDDDEDAASEAASAGVQEVQFNVVGDEEFELRNGYLGIAVSYAGETESIPFVQDARDLEYQLTSLITELTVEDKPVVAFATGFGAKSPDTELGAFPEELRTQYEVETVSLEEGDAPEIPEDATALVLAGPTTELSDEAAEAVTGWLEGGGALLALVDGVSIDPQALQATEVPEPVRTLLEPWGVTVEPAIAYDLRSNITAQFSDGIQSYLVPYAYWPRLAASPEHAVTRELETLPMRWPSPLAIDEDALDEQGLAVQELLRTSDAGGADVEPWDLNPQSPPSDEDLSSQVVSVAISGAEDGDEGAPRLVVIGGSDLLSSEALQAGPEGGILGLEAVSWLTQESSLASIQARASVQRTLDLEDESTADVIKWGNMLLVLLVPAGLGTWRLVRRRRLRGREYPAASA